MIDGLHRLRHHTVVGGDHQDGDVGGLGAAGAHGGERLVARGVDERDQTLDAVMVHGHLVGTDVLGDATGLALAHAGLADGVQQSGLAVVDVTHDGDDRRTLLEVFFAALVLAVGQVEGLQEFAVLVLGRDHLDDVVHLAAQQFQGLVTHRLGRGHHLAEVEQRLYQRRRVGVDLLGEIAQRGAAGQPDDFAVAVRKAHATDDRGLHVLVLGAFRPLRLAATPGRSTGTAEGTGGTTALAGTATAATAAGTASETSGSCTGGGSATGAAGAVVTAAAATTGTGALTGAGPGTATGTWATGTPGGAGAGAGRSRRHVARRGTARSRTATWTRGHATGTGARSSRDLRTGNRALHRLGRGERVVAHPRWARPAGLGCGRTGTRAGCGNWRRSGDRGHRCDHWGWGSRGRRNGSSRFGNRGCGWCGGHRAGIGDGLNRRRLCGGFRGSLLRRLGTAEGFAQPARDGRFHGRRRRFDELTLFTQASENFLACDTEFLSQLVHAGLTCHYISISRGDSGGWAAPRV